MNVFGASGSGKTHLSKILENKIKKVKNIDASSINNETIAELNNFECIIIDNYKNNIEEKILYSMLNQSRQLSNYILINSVNSIKDTSFKLKDLKSRINSFVFIGIDLPTDELLKVIISKSFSDKQVNISPKISEYIVRNIERSYEKLFKFLKDIDELSLASGKSININLIKKVLDR